MSNPEQPAASVEGSADAAAPDVAAPPAGWQPYPPDPAEEGHTVVGNLRVFEGFHSPQLGNRRDVLVYLPPSYEAGGKRYPVIYMQDGQNLFNEATSFADEWRVDNTMDALSRARGLEAVVVGVPNAGEGRLAQRVRIGRHVLRADEPVRLGGQDTGPTPYELLLAALGACTAMTLRLYADREGWPLEDVRVDLRHRKIHASDCASCETQVGMLDRIERRLDLVGPLDEAQRARLREIADRCPVHRTLTSEIVIESL